MATQCPFIFSQFIIEKSVAAKVKPFELRIACFEDNCPSKMWEVKRCINPNAEEKDRIYIGGHCTAIVNICENCHENRRCKKTGSVEEKCRQDRIDSIFRVPILQQQKQPTTPESTPDHNNTGSYTATNSKSVLDSITSDTE
jgi:hypothetical protein